MILSDLKRYKRDERSTGWAKVFVSTPGFRFMVMHRLCNEYSRLNPIGFVSRIWHARLKVKFGFQIPHTTKIDAGLFMGHFGGIVINQKVRIGRNCNIGQGVTIGQTNRGERSGTPTIGERVWIGPNAVIVGDIKVGNDVLIAPLSYVNTDVPDNAVVMGNPAKVVAQTGSAGYINFPV